MVFEPVTHIKSVHSPQNIWFYIYPPNIQTRYKKMTQFQGPQLILLFVEFKTGLWFWRQIFERRVLNPSRQTWTPARTDLRMMSCQSATSSSTQYTVNWLLRHIRHRCHFVADRGLILKVSRSKLKVTERPSTCFWMYFLRKLTERGPTGVSLQLIPGSINKLNQLALQLIFHPSGGANMWHLSLQITLT